MWASIIAAAISAIAGIVGNSIAKKRAAANKSSSAGDIGSAVANMATTVGGAISANQAIKQQQKFNSTEAQKAREWNLDVDNTRYQRTVADMQAAGVNPALAIDGHLSTQATSNVSAQSESGVNAMTQLMALAGQMRLQTQQLKQDKELKSRELDIKQSEVDAKNRNLNSQSDILDIEKEFKRQEKELQMESYRVQNDLTRKEAAQIDAKIDEIKAHTDLLVKQAATEEEKKLLTIAQTALANANAYQVMALLPYQQKLMEAQTENQKAAAGLALVEKMWKQGLIDKGYLENMVKLQGGELTAQEYDNLAKAFDVGMSTGTWFDNNTVIGKASNFIAAGAAQLGKLIKSLIPINIGAKIG